jgi:hypothetical protein
VQFACRSEILGAKALTLPKQATISKTPGKTNENPRSSDPSRIAISFALPIFAQEKEEVKAFPFTPIPAGPQLVHQIEAINQKFDEALLAKGRLAENPNQPNSIESPTRRESDHSH